MDELFAERNKKWWVCLSVLLLILMTNIDMTGVTLALPPIGNRFHSDISTLQWIIDGYLIAGAAFVILGGRLGDIYGKRAMFILGTLLFVIASVGAGVSENSGSLITARVIQGIGAAICWPLGIVIISATFPKQQQGLALGLLTASMAISSSFGPTIGGAVIHLAGWRWIFLINLPLGGLALILAFFAMSRDGLDGKKGHIHLPSVILLCVSLFSMMAVLNEGQHWGLTSPLFFSVFCTGFAIFLVFLYLQFRVREPLLPLSLLTNKIVQICICIRFILQFTFTLILFTISLLMQNIFGFSVLDTGFIMFSLSLSIGLASPFAGHLSDYFQEKHLMFIGALLQAIAYAIFAFLHAESPFWLFVFPLILCGAGVGLVLPCIFKVALNAVGPDKKATVGGVLYANLFLGGAFSVAIGGVVLGVVSRYRLHSLIGNLKLALTSAQQRELEIISSGTISIDHLSQVFDPEISALLTPLVKASFLQGFSWLMWVCSVLSGVAALSALTLTSADQQEGSA
ncbi:MAG: MFS transporter [Waddliaceae bacterium]